MAIRWSGQVTLRVRHARFPAYLPVGGKFDPHELFGTNRMPNSELFLIAQADSQVSKRVNCSKDEAISTNHALPALGTS